MSDHISWEDLKAQMDKDRCVCAECLEERIEAIRKIQRHFRWRQRIWNWFHIDIG